MKRIFKRRFSRSNSTDGVADPAHPQVRRRSLPDDSSFEILHATTQPGSRSAGIVEGVNPFEASFAGGGGRGSMDRDTLLPTSSLEESTVLSDTETLHFDRLHRLGLQDTYNENFVHYLPYVLRRMRLASVPTSTPTSTDNGPPTYVDEYFDDDQLTIFNETFTDNQEEVNDPTLGRHLILDKQTARYNVKRTFIIAGEFIKNNTYLFVDRSSFQKFKSLRANNKKVRKDSVIVYDKDGNIKKLFITPQTKLDERTTTINGSVDDIIDHRQHIIPVEHKLKGEGLPLMKVQVPYMSSFRKHTPFMIFRRYREIPLKPSRNEVIHHQPMTDEEHEDNFQSYRFCAVHTKNFLFLKRYTFKFTPLDRPLFTLLVFQHNFRQFADFKYRNTRFRVIGTPLTGGYLVTYNPHMKLFVVDDDKPSLSDNVINKKSRSTFTRRKSTSDEADYFDQGLSKKISEDRTSPTDTTEIIDSPTDPSSEYPNPHPDASNPLLSDSHYGFFSYTSEAIKPYVPNDLPPFGEFSDAQTYLGLQSILPKKYTETGKIELYQDGTTLNNQSQSSSLSVDFDSMVINCVMLTLRENSLRNSQKTSTSGFGGRIAAMTPSLGPSQYMSS